MKPQMEKEKYFLFLAGYTIELLFIKKQYFNINNFSRKNFKQFFEHYLTSKRSKKVDFRIIVSDTAETKINYAKKSVYMKLYEKTTDNEIVVHPSLNIFQIQIVVADIIKKLFANSSSLVLHSSAVLIKDKAYLFLGDNCAGKSTIVTMLKKKFLPLSDDVSFIRRKKEKYYYYQTPYQERNKYKIRKTSIKLGKIFFLKKSLKTQVKRISLINNSSYRYLLKRQIRNHYTEVCLKKFVFATKNQTYELSFSLKSSINLLKDCLYNMS
jgi:ATPase subunit of ABC transporter with duplicated ATPase domains